MKPVVSKCGNHCSSCPWGVWVRRDQSEEEWDSFFEEVKKYVGYSPTKNPCHGCQTPDEELSKDVGVHNFLRGCSARKCAFHNNIRNCAYCSRYPCDKIRVMNIGNSRSDAEERIGEPIPDDMYMKYVRIFEGMKTLDEIHRGLKPEEIQLVETVDYKPTKIVPFPKAKMEYTRYKKLHEALSTILNSKFGLSDIDTLAGQEMLKERRTLLLRLLWILARFGVIEGETLSIDSITLTAHKKHATGVPTNEAVWNRWFDTLYKIGIYGELRLAPIDRELLTTPMGWLRGRVPGSNDPAWHLHVSLDEELGGKASLLLLQSYAYLLDDKYGTRAFSKFTKDDMRLFEKES